MIFNFSKKPLRMSFKYCLVIQTIAGTVDSRFNNFWHFVKHPNFSILLLLLLFLFGRATVKLKHNVSVNTIDRSLKYQYPVQWAFKSAKVFRPLHYKAVAPALLSNYRATCGALIRKQCMSTQTVWV